jgi:two-component system nitrate/nitrite sensor histidine kinase NarX
MNLQLRSRWSSSTLLRVATVLGAVTLLAAAVVLTAAWFTEQSTGKGVAINIAGSLRMQSYLLATRVADQRADSATQRAAIATDVAGFEQRLADPRLREALPQHSALRAQYDRIETAWAALRPQALAAADDPAARDRFLSEVHPFVAGIDTFVRAVEADLESRIHGLQVALGSALFLILVLVVTAFFVLDIQVFQPIKELVRLTQAVRGGVFSVRAEATGQDEIGQLGRDFNHMVEELGRLYGSLEAQIAAKTSDLAQKNRSLLLLYDTARELSSAQLDQATLRRVADKAREVLGVQGVVVCARQAGTATGLPLASAEREAGAICDAVQCAGCLDDAKVHWHDLRTGAQAGADGAADALQQVVSVPIVDGAKLYGVMPLMLAPGQTLDSWQLELAQTVGRHLGAALSAAEARDEHRRLALLEERSAIARELHDSLAQSLSYTKIQLTRLSALLGAPSTPPEQAREVVQELREGVSTAYRQLRELLTTFRLQLSGKGLQSALQEAVADFTARCGIEVALDNGLFGLELSANEQIHVLQIVREALSNIEHHSGARQATVRLQRSAAATGGAGEVEVMIEDDGVGIATQSSPRHHFGLSIMRDRAQMLGGEVTIARARAEGERPGTRVTLRFPSAPYRSREPAGEPLAAE